MALEAVRRVNYDTYLLPWRPGPVIVHTQIQLPRSNSSSGGSKKICHRLVTTSMKRHRRRRLTTLLIVYVPSH